eukprot:2713706-Alexandrium_andersonii.AAC.1
MEEPDSGAAEQGEQRKDGNGKALPSRDKLLAAKQTLLAMGMVAEAAKVQAQIDSLPVPGQPGPKRLYEMAMKFFNEAQELVKEKEAGVKKAKAQLQDLEEELELLKQDQEKAMEARDAAAEELRKSLP